jgi:hypothetical protein
MQCVFANRVGTTVAVWRHWCEYCQPNLYTDNGFVANNISPSRALTRPIDTLLVENTKSVLRVNATSVYNAGIDSPATWHSQAQNRSIYLAPFCNMHRRPNKCLSTPLPSAACERRSRAHHHSIARTSSMYLRCATTAARNSCTTSGRCAPPCHMHARTAITRTLTPGTRQCTPRMPTRTQPMR